MDVAVHDLLRIDPEALIGDMPDWARSALADAPWVVVRRALSSDGRIAVGVRGQTRDQRFAAWLPVAGVTAHVTPYDIVRDGLAGRRRMLPALAALDTVLSVMAGTPYVWGPGGSVGFELVTGYLAVTEQSDLDIILRAPEYLDRARAADLLDRLPLRSDVRLEVPRGAVALREYVRGGRMVLKTCEGPCLVDDPWDG
ncbi:malonate decarboxylase holo-ACP synthase [Govanella unica]|uniref:Malonate decarboxylase holo-ACP synthase n=1 Tax=Govanella unica TaxID=2975056 RepID=A0A9X3TYN1_9PROT|nr:malonate decarboxylase holo-ACP synthase [Govania unica]MDA5194203.1 malonate decarboxylase holo-ACP synthase [Govania unica]